MNSDKHVLQDITFSKKKYNKASAIDWLNSNGYFPIQPVVETSNELIYILDNRNFDSGYAVDLDKYGFVVGFYGYNH